MATPVSHWLRHVQLFLINSRVEFKEIWQEARSQRPLPSLCFSGRSEKNEMAIPASDLPRHFRLFLWHHWTKFNENLWEARSQSPVPSLCFSGRWKKTRWPPWPLIGWDIFDSFSEIAEWNAMKLDRKQDLNVLYQICVFPVDRKKKDDRPGLLLAETFSTSPLKLLNRIQPNLTGNKISTSSTKFMFSGR